MSKELFRHACSELDHSFTFASCNKHAWLCFQTAFQNSAKIYGPLFLITGILTRKIFSPKYVVTHFVPSVCRSSAMIAIIGSLWIRVACLLNTANGAHFRYHYWLNTLVGATLGILAEKKERHAELAVYVTQNAVDNVYRMLANRNILPHIEHGLTLMYACAMGILYAFQKYDRKLLGSSEGAFVNTVVGIEDQPDAMERFLAQQLRMIKSVFRLAVAPSSDLPVGTPKEHVSSPLLSPKFAAHVNLTRLCCHKSTCVDFGLLGYVKGFLIGYSFKSLTTLIPALVKPSKFTTAAGRSKIITKCFGHPAVRLGLFLSLMSGGTRSIQCLLRQIRGKEDPVNNFVAAFIGGLSFHLSGSLDFSAYVFSKAADTFYKFSKAKGYVTPLPHGKVITFVLSTMVIFYNLYWEPHNVRPSYFGYMNSVTDGIWAQMIKSSHEMRCQELSGPNLANYLQWYQNSMKKYLRPFASLYPK
eukprot:TRINITY_DN9975_c0_g1_i1.p1 TRINITY_DN9975_c0_g1~~TRINITY_DN9975_c0_g1_i1.p1  ORF type:complete len:472 (+),score=93.39 TRINITY_DN9975_c0_g1_i1:155-1570(+)